MTSTIPSSTPSRPGNGETLATDTRVLAAWPTLTGLISESATVINHVPDIDAYNVEIERDGEIRLIPRECIVRTLGKFELVGAPGDADAALGRAFSAAMFAASVPTGRLAAELHEDPDHLIALLQGRAQWSVELVVVTSYALDLDPVAVIASAYGRGRADAPGTPSRSLTEARIRLEAQTRRRRAARSAPAVDGLACVDCGANLAVPGSRSVPVGFGPHGQNFKCAPDTGCQVGEGDTKGDAE